MSLMSVSSDFAGFRHDTEILALRFRDGCVQEQIGHADDRIHRRADFVAHVGEKIAFGPTGGIGVFAGFAKFRFDVFLRTDIQHKAHALGGFGIERSHADDHRHAAAFFADVFLLPGFAAPDIGQLLNRMLIQSTIFGRRHLIPANQPGLQIGPCVTHDVQKGVVAFSNQAAS